jgi:malate dehydrogenase (quinone)
MRKLIFLFIGMSLLSCDRSPMAPAGPAVDVVLIGGGIMSATLGTILKDLEPNLSMEIFERLDQVALESSAAWNNAGTGHAAFAELNYTPEKADGSISIKKAIEINELFAISKQFWAYQVAHKNLSARDFIHSVPHLSFVFGETDVSFLKKRAQALSKNLLFQDMEYSEDPEQIKAWVPLVMEGRDPKQKIAATRVNRGTDVDFGALTKSLMASLIKKPHTKLFLKHEIIDIKRNEDQSWLIVVKNLSDNQQRVIKAKFVFIGAGGAALPLLQKSGIPEAKGYAGFPVGGQWLITDNPDLIKRHHGKVYGMASVGAPPMSVPHLDTRIINGKASLLFGPFATFSTKFLKTGSWMDMFQSISSGNLIPMIQAGWHNLDLTHYLITQVLLSKEQRVETLKQYFPTAKIEDWRVADAGQRVQIIKDDPKQGGILQFGTELVGASDGTIIALLGASPGASTAVEVALSVLKRCFKDDFTGAWHAKIKAMVPSYGQHLYDNPELFKQVEQNANRWLELEP